MDDTIAAVSTPFGEGAIAVLRLSGGGAIGIADAIFVSRVKASQLASRVQQFGKIVDHGEHIDDVMLTVFHAPASYTGENVVEISCHGGILVTRRILNLVLDAGARSAEPGEFTQRAFLNGKMDLTQAEAVMDLIRAQTDLALRAATEQLEGRLGVRIREIREELLELLAHIEAYIDFPEEDIDPVTGETLMDKLEAVRAKISALLQTADQGKILREGVRTVIYGAPNVGKSSLLNLLLGYERAIVSEIPGTTRDTLEEVINLGGIPIRLIDTAGLRDSADAIEQEGIARTLKNIERADLVLHVADASAPRHTVLWSAETGTNRPEVFVLNKTDLGEHQSWQATTAVRMSCKTNDGIEQLAAAITERVMHGGASSADYRIAINARHQACLKKSEKYADAALGAMRGGVLPEFVVMDIRAALDAVGEVVGNVDSEELLGKIFSTFCIGK
ncbi:MAG: tRNA modification GTPase [Chthoniobacter sp.]|jgi:tRNA modification GTPase|nr:tRNA modification GTPase [Chthoniobacter sp.]